MSQDPENTPDDARKAPGRRLLAGVGALCAGVLRACRRLLRVTGGSLTTLLLVLLGLLAWLGLTTSGLKALVSIAEEVSGEALRVETVDGRLLGRMELSGIALRTATTDADINRVEFKWIPGYVPALTFYLDRLQVEGVQLALRSTDAEPPEEEPAAPLDIFIPLRVVLNDVRVSDVTATIDGEPLPDLDLAELRGHASARTIAIERLHASQPDYGDYTLEARLRTEPGALDIRRLELQGPGTLNARGRLMLDASDADLALDWQELHWPPGAPREEQLFLSPEGRLAINGGLDDARLSGHITLAPQGTMDLSAHWQGDSGVAADLRWRELEDPLYPHARIADATPLWRSPKGQLELRGLPEAWQLSGELTGDLPGLLPLPPARGTADEVLAVSASQAQATPATPTRGRGHSEAETTKAQPSPVGPATQPAAATSPEAAPLQLVLEARGDLESARIQRLELRALRGLVTSEEGQIRWAPQIQGRLRLRLRDIDPQPLVADFPGRLNGVVTGDFALPRSGLRGKLKISLADSVLRGYPLTLDTTAQLEDERLLLENLRLRSARSTVTAQGALLPELDLSAGLASPDLTELHPAAGGALRLSLGLSGPAELPALRLDAEGSNVRFAGLRGASLRAQGAIKPERHSNLQLATTDLQLAGVAMERLDLSLRGPAEAHELSVNAKLPQGAVALALFGAAELQDRRWQGHLRRLDIRPSQGAAWALREPAALRLATGSAELGALCLAAEGDAELGSLCLEARHDAGGSQASYRLDRLDLAYLDTFLPAGMRVSGRIDGNGDIALDSTGALRRADSRLQLAQGALRVADKPPLDFGPVTLDTGLAEDEHLMARLTGNLAGGSLDGEARVALAPDGPLSARLQADLQRLDFLPLFSREVSQAEGRLSLAAEVAGTVATPQVQLRAQLREGVLALRGPGLTLEPLTADIDTDAEGRLRLHLEATSGGGTVQVEGEADVLAQPMSADIRVRGEDFQIARLPEARAWVSPDLRISLAETVEVRGEVRIPRARLEPEKFSGAGGIAPHPDQVIVRGDDASQEAPMLPVNARVTAQLGDDVSLDGYGLETRLAGTLTVIEEPERVTRARGALTLEDGRYEAYGQRLAIERGRIVYAGGPVDQPGLDFQAVRTPRPDIRVGVIVRGTIEQPEFQLFSEPAMSQNEQLSWLVLGRAPPGSGEENAEDSSMLAQAALALGLSGGDWLARNVGSKIGIDEISVGTKDGETSEQARLTVGKYIGSRLYISYAVSLFQPGNIFSIRYDLGRGFSLQTETGIESGGDLFYTLER